MVYVKMDFFVDFGGGGWLGSGMKLRVADLLAMNEGDELKFFTDFPGRHRALITQASKRHRMKFETQYVSGVLVVKRVAEGEGRHPKVVIPLRLDRPKRKSKIRAVVNVDSHGDWRVLTLETLESRLEESPVVGKKEAVDGENTAAIAIQNP